MASKEGRPKIAYTWSACHPIPPARCTQIRRANAESPDDQFETQILLAERSI